MDVKAKIDGLTEAKAKAALLWALEGLSYRLRCDECPSQYSCSQSEPLWKSNMCWCNLLEAALKEAQK